MKRQIASLEEENRKMEMEICSLESRGRIESIAQETGLLMEISNVINIQKEENENNESGE